MHGEPDMTKDQREAILAKIRVAEEALEAAELLVMKAEGRTDAGKVATLAFELTVVRGEYENTPTED